MRFLSVMKIRGINPYVAVSAARAKALRSGWRRPLPVLLRVNERPSVPWRINLMPAGDGSFYLYLHGEIRHASGSKVGDRVRIELRPDATYKNGPQHPMPRWFRSALGRNPAAAKNWQALIPSRKKEVLRYFAGLKSEEARSRNLERALHVLSGRPGRFMARTWG